MNTNYKPEDFGITKYTWRDTVNGKVLDCHQNVDLYNKGLNELPFQFGVVDGYFNCSVNKLTSLKGCPEIVREVFWCNHNKLESLEFGPKEVKCGYYCHHNMLKTLKGAPRTYTRFFVCNYNKKLPRNENTYEKYLEKYNLK